MFIQYAIFSWTSLKKFTYVVVLIRLRRITKSPTMLFDGCLVLLSLVAQANNNIANNANSISDALNLEVAIFMWFSMISCNMMNSLWNLQITCCINNRESKILQVFPMWWLYYKTWENFFHVSNNVTNHFHLSLSFTFFYILYFARFCKATSFLMVKILNANFFWYFILMLCILSLINCLNFNWF